MGLLTAFSQYEALERSVFILNFLRVTVLGLALGLALFPAVAAVYNRLERSGKPQEIRKDSYWWLPSVGSHRVGHD